MTVSEIKGYYLLINAFVSTYCYNELRLEYFRVRVKSILGLGSAYFRVRFRVF